MDEFTGLIGRNNELNAGLVTLRKGGNLLLTGPAGVGKIALLRGLYNAMRGERPCLWVSQGAAKEQAYQLAVQTFEQIGLVVPPSLIAKRFQNAARKNGVQWKMIERSVGRMPARECITMVVDSLMANGETVPLVYFESLELPPSQAVFFTSILEVAQVAACMDTSNRRIRIQRVLWKFPEQDRITVKPLPQEACREIAEQWLRKFPIRFDSERTRAAFLRSVEQDSGGMPVAIKGMLETASTESVVTRELVRGFVHEAGVTYIDMTPVVVLLAGGIMAARYIGRGIGNVELTLLAGIGMGLLLVIRFFIMPMMLRK